MPLSALTEVGDLVSPFDFVPEVFDAMIGARKSPAFFCQFCEWRMHPKRFRHTNTRFFAHNQGSQCSHAAAYESMDHLAIKTKLVYQINRVSGWRGVPEEFTRLPDGTEYIADVVARHTTKRKEPWAWEVQLSPQSNGETQRRTEQIQRGHGRCTWVTMDDTEWFKQFPSVMLGPEQSMVVAGLQQPAAQGVQDEWVPMHPRPLGMTISDFLRDQYIWVESVGFVERGAWGGGPGPGRPPAPESTRVPDDYCDRLGNDVPLLDLGRELLGIDTRQWRDAEWIGRARMARARRHAGKRLDGIDQEALRRWPHDVPLGEIDFYERRPII